MANEATPMAMLRVMGKLSSICCATRSGDRADGNRCAEHHDGEGESGDERESEALGIFETE